MPASAVQHPARHAAKQKLLVIMNRSAHGGRPDTELERALDHLRLDGHELAVEVTDGRGSARRIVAGLARYFDRVVACGGDGTLSEVAAGLHEARARASLVVVPAGTANDFAKALGITAPPAQVLRRAALGVPAPLDLGICGETPFINAVTIGGAAEISRRVPKWLKSALGPLSYVVTGATQPTALEPFHARLESDAIVYEGSFIQLSIANGRTVGGGTKVAPEAFVDDGWLDVTVVPDLPNTELLGVLRAMRRGEIHPKVIRWQGRHLRLTADRHLTMSRDGEPLTASCLEFRVLPAAIWSVQQGRAPARRWFRWRRWHPSHSPFPRPAPMR